MSEKAALALVIGVLVGWGVASANDRNLDPSQVGVRLGPPNFRPLGGQNTCASPHLPFGANPTTVSSTLSLSGFAGVVAGLDVELQITHTWVTDIVATLEHDGTIQVLIDRPGIPSLGGCGCSGDDVDVVLSDAGSSSVENACNPAVPAISGTLTPSPGSLSAFDGADPNGDWTLTVSDGFPALDDGTFETWCLNGGQEFTGGSPTPATSPRGAVVLIVLFLGVSIFYLRRRSSTSP